jgi:glycosyltransferase involved in cell wall biosynthesis
MTTNGSVRISYVIPVHNEEAILRETSTAIVQRLAGHPGSELILVENGSSDRSPQLVRQLAEELRCPSVTVRAAQSAKGYGNAARRGLELATGELVIFSAADLPFRFTDLDEALAFDPRPPLIIGSKAHPASVVESSLARRVLSFGFSVVRQLALGVKAGDTQGSLLVDGDLARRLRPALRCEDYLLSTELVACAVRCGILPTEVPVRYENPRRGSKVRPLRDSVRMLRGLLELRSRLRDLRPTGTVVPTPETMRSEPTPAQPTPAAAESR